jgi:hypothetical protein
MSINKLCKYDLRSGALSLKDTQLLEEGVEVESLDELKSHVLSAYPGELIWVIDKSGKTKPFTIVMVRPSSEPLREVNP